jgi:predicted transcriptional regulator
MATLLEMTASIVASHAQTYPMTTNDLIQELMTVYATLQGLESGAPEVPVLPIDEEPITLTLKQAFKTNEVICMICGKGGMKTLTRHLNQAHQLKPSQYRKQFSIPKIQPLMSKSYAARRKEIAAGMNLTGNLAKARSVRQANMADKKAKVPAVRDKAPVPAVRRKAAVLAKGEKK